MISFAIITVGPSNPSGSNKGISDNMMRLFETGGIELTRKLKSVVGLTPLNAQNGRVAFIPDGDQLIVQNAR